MKYTKQLFFYYYYFQYQVFRNNTLAVILTKDHKKCQWQRRISQHDSGHPPTCEALHQLISRYVAKHTERVKQRFSSAAEHTGALGKKNWKQTGLPHLQRIAKSQERLILSKLSIKRDFFRRWGGFSWLQLRSVLMSGLRMYRAGHLQHLRESDQACDASLSRILL